MYIPDHYENKNQEELIHFINENPFGIIVVQGENAPVASHIPFMVKGSSKDGYHLVGHLSKKNQIAQLIKKALPVLVIFNGPQHYISSSWYKQEEVPTWNYIAVHAYGSIAIQSEFNNYIWAISEKEREILENFKNKQRKAGKHKTAGKNLTFLLNLYNNSDVIYLYLYSISFLLFNPFNSCLRFENLLQ